MTVVRRGAIVLSLALSLQMAASDQITRVIDTLYVVYDTASLVERLQSEEKSRKISGPAELSQAMFDSDALVEALVDPWGTPLHIAVTPGKGYVIAAAGSDRKFDRSSWSTPAKTASAADDVVLRDGVLVRSPEEWVVGQAKFTPGQLRGEISRSKHQVTVASLRALASAMETRLAIEGKFPPVGDIDALAKQLEPDYGKNLPRTDGWGRKLDLAMVSTLDGYVVISAGPDGKFETADDIILENGLLRNGEPPAADRLVEAWAGYMAARGRLQQAK